MRFVAVNTESRKHSGLSTPQGLTTDRNQHWKHFLWGMILNLDTCIFNMTFPGMLQTESVSLSVLVICPNQSKSESLQTGLQISFVFLLWLMKDSKNSFQCHCSNWNNWGKIQLNLSTVATLGTEETGHCKEVAVVERFWTRINVWIFCLLGQKKWPL